MCSSNDVHDEEVGDEARANDRRCIDFLLGLLEYEEETMTDVEYLAEVERARLWLQDQQG